MTSKELTENKIKKIFKTSNIFDIIPVNRWWENKNDLDLENHNDNEEEETNKNGDKFQSLEHNGVLFPSAYVPHNIEIKCKNEYVKLNTATEEVATFWAQVLENDLSKLEIPRANFFKTFKSMLIESSPDYATRFEKSQLEDFDFSPILEYLQAQKLKTKNKTPEEKKEEKEKKNTQSEFYGLALVDKYAEKISNFMVEPPGIYRGRGDHPACGRIKPRIIPEDITINVGLDDPVPICHLNGHSWKEVINNMKSTWLATYKEDKHTKYVFLAGNSKFKGMNDLKKYEKARKLKTLISKIREDYHKQMNSDVVEKKQLGVATYLIDILALRVGNEKGDDEADTVGCCSLRVEHIKLEAADSPSCNSVTFDFLGKDSMRYFNTVELDQNVVKCLRVFVRGKNPEDDLFDLINASKLNDYLKSIYSGLSAKVFRTYNASFTLQKQLDECKLSAEKSSVDDKVNFYDDANRKVAILCNHQRTVPKSFNAQSVVLNQQLKDLLRYQEELRVHIESFKSKGKKKGQQTASAKKNEEDDEEGASKLKKIFPDTLEKTQKLINQTTEKITKLERKITSRDENKEVALNTSKLNYMDPRITVSFCKRLEVPIEKVFPKSVREKFPWAMYIELDYKF